MTLIVEIIEKLALRSSIKVIQIVNQICMGKKLNDFNDQGHADFPLLRREGDALMRPPSVGVVGAAKPPLGHTLRYRLKD
ncbi:hypothetical protein FV217_03865 [Methylobacterium sp. WL9]|nr:hypothetical protein FV217_03865 [Methylobacterium sp. WL9]